MQNKRRIAIFDFCETLVDFQTADAFVDYVRVHINDPSICRKEKINLLLRKYRITRIAEKVTSYRCSVEKRLKLWQLKGINRATLDDLAYAYYKEKIKPHLIGKTNELMKQHQSAGDEVWLISGGYGIYLKFFKEEYKINKLISSNIRFHGDVCTGKMDGLDCMNKNKVELFKQILTQSGWGEVIASYSDSISDTPILSVAECAYVISRTHQEWAERYHFNEIVWTKDNLI